MMRCRMQTKIYTAPAEEPVTIEEAKLQCRVDTADEDVLFERLISAARRYVETFQRRALITQTWEAYLDAWPSEAYIDLPYPPLQSVTSITYKDTAGSASTFGSANYIVDIGRTPGRVYLAYDASWPSTTLYPTSGITVRYVCGYGATGKSVPAETRQGLLLLVAHLYENREATVERALTFIPFGVEALLWGEREFRF